MTSWAAAGVTVSGEKPPRTGLPGDVPTPATAPPFAHTPWQRITWWPAASAYIYGGGAVATLAQSRELVDFWINQDRRQRRSAELEARAA